MSAEEPLIVALDGPSGVGKSSVAQRLAARLGVPFLETGAMYRALGLKVLQAGVDPADQRAVEALASRLDLRLEPREAGQVDVLLDGEPLGERVRAPEVGEVTSQISVYPAVRRAMVDLQRRGAGERGAVVEGRDIGSRVFPRTPYKFYLDAPLEVRVKRRHEQLRATQGRAPSAEEVRREVEERDHRDSTRDDSPLRRDASYVEIATGGMTLDEVVERLVAEVERIRATRATSRSG